MKHFAKMIAASAVTATLLASCGGNQVNKNVSLKNDVDSASYSLGMMYGNSLSDGFTEVNINAMVAALQTMLDNDTTNLKLTIPQAQACLQELSMKIRQKQMEKAQQEASENLLRGQQFLEDNAKKDGVTSLPNGVQYIVMEEGNGDKPEATDTVEVDYHGTLIDGTVFDSSVQRGEPIKFPVNGVIQGWQETLPLMPVGSKWKIFIPAELAYGAQGRPGIPANSVLIFEVTLHQIFKGPKEK